MSTDIEGAGDPGHLAEDLGQTEDAIGDSTGNLSDQAPRLYEEALRHQERRKMLSKLLDAECTFQPQTNAAKRRSTVPAAPDAVPSPVHERLYGKAKEIEYKRQEKSRVLGEECTFAPTLTKAAIKLKEAEKAEGKSIYSTLYEKAKDQAQRLEVKSKELALEGCTFSPAITGKAKKITRPGTAASRLYDPEWVKARHSLGRNDPASKDTAECTFKPKLSRPSTAGPPRPSGAADEVPAVVFDRLFAGGKARETDHELARKQLESMKLAECTFKPDLHSSKQSGRMIGITGTNGSPTTQEGVAPNPYDRLYAHALEKAQRLQMQPTTAELGCTFKPAISVASRKITDSTRDPSTADLPRHLMLYEDGLQRQQARASLEANRGRDITDDDVLNCTFKPEIAAMPATSIVTVPVYDRLYENARARQATLAAAASGAPLPISPHHNIGVHTIEVSRTTPVNHGPRHIERQVDRFEEAGHSSPSKEMFLI